MTRQLRLPLVALLLVACSSGGGYYRPFDLAGRADGGGGDPMDLAGPPVDFAGKEVDLATPPPACNDGRKNGNETDADCGGGTCPRCNNGRACLAPSDCLSGVCQGGICQAAPSCNDGIRNGNETDVDCGGGTCSRCFDGQRCAVGSDCDSGLCQGGVCQAAPSCNDGIKNGKETDIDCGGGTCAACFEGDNCVGNSDCQSFKCSNTLCCAPDRNNCDFNAGNGCESDPMTDARNCGGCGNVCPMNMPLCVNGQCAGGGGGGTYSQNFTNGSNSTNQCTVWNTFRQGLFGNYASVTMRGSLDNVGVTCVGASANTICQALRTGTATTIACGGRTWKIGTCGNGIELSADGTTCQCTMATGYSVRPCIGNSNWGGIRSNTCTGPTQTMTVICQ